MNTPFLKGLFCSEVMFEVNQYVVGVFEVNCLFEVNDEINDIAEAARPGQWSTSAFFVVGYTGFGAVSGSRHVSGGRVP
ncbi:hypothetical protein HP437_00300 (plasmid) [Serratia marcescens]|jgi:hypothetical protein|uniref:hypothetical protein n=1 Tax=Serratia marcescens TaxID=615 RepID=UPI0015D6D2B3|nr:hypothetical protein [Serratia marcescens]QLJ63724.1 hypothetical protein HP437_00300 [Serratia marcescens]HEJ7174845.1 hypothetical protein [Serratia marcescens]